MKYFDVAAYNTNLVMEQNANCNVLKRIKDKEILS